MTIAIHQILTFTSIVEEALLPQKAPQGNGFTYHQPTYRNNVFLYFFRSEEGHLMGKNRIDSRIFRSCPLEGTDETHPLYARN